MSRLSMRDGAQRATIATVAVLLIAGAIGAAGLAGATGYILGYSPGYYLGYGGVDCPSPANCADPDPNSRTAPTSRGVRFIGSRVNGSVAVPPGSVGFGRYTTLRVDVSPPTATPSPTPPAGFSETALTNLLSFDVRTGPYRGLATPATNLGKPLSYRPDIDIHTRPARPTKVAVPGVPSAEIVAYVRDGAAGAWRELPRLAARQPLPAGQAEGFRIDEYAYPSGYVYRFPVLLSRKPSGVFALFRRAALPPVPAPPPPPPPVAQPAAKVSASFLGRPKGRITVSTRGTFRVPCRVSGAARGRCSATARGARKVILGSGSAALVRGKANVPVSLTRKARRQLRKQRSLAVTVELVARPAGMSAISQSTRVTLRAARRR